MNERGFSTLEILVSAALLVALGLGTLGVLGTFARALHARAGAADATISLESTLAEMRAGAAGAYAVFVPATDVFGAPNGAGALAHELDYYARTDDGTELWWAYRFDAPTLTLRRYDYAPASGGGPPTVGVADRATGGIDPRAQYPALAGVREFTVATLEASRLASDANVFGPLLRTLGVRAVSEPVGFVPRSGGARADLFGGNATLAVSIATDRGTRAVHLASAAAPSGFTVRAKPAFRALVYRLDVTHRFWFGVAQKTWARIFEQVQVSYAPADPASWKVWCDFELYGAGSNGLALNDPHATYRPAEWNESSAGALYAASAGDLAQLDPQGCTGPLPGP